MIATLSFTSCHYMLNVKPETLVTFTNYFENEKDIEAITFQIHSYLKTCLAFNDHSKMGEFADELQDANMGGLRQLNPQNILNSVNIDWSNHYKIIYLCNVILDEAHRVTDIRQDRMNFHLGQAQFVKGYMYFHLTRIHGDVIITKNSTTTTAYKTSPAIECINEAIRCARLAFDLLPVYEQSVNIAGAPTGTKQFGSKGSVAALLAHAYAWKGSIIDIYKIAGEDSKAAYKESVYWSSQLIDKKVGTTYNFEETIKGLCENSLMGMGAKSMESIFEYETDMTLRSPNNYTPTYMYITYPVDMTKGAGAIKNTRFRIKNSTVEKMYSESDERRTSYFNKTTFDTTSVAVNGGYAYPWKWRKSVYTNTVSGAVRFLTLEGNYVYWRLTDFYLLRAECNAKLGNDGLAITDLNKIRERANAELYPASQETDLKYAIFKEREKELLMEGHRYYDVIRNGYWKTELEGGFKTLTDQDVKDGALYMPIGVGAFAYNDIIRQNRYWARYE